MDIVIEFTGNRDLLNVYVTSYKIENNCLVLTGARRFGESESAPNERTTWYLPLYNILRFIPSNPGSLNRYVK